jgi:hypothetical protein
MKIRIVLFVFFAFGFLMAQQTSDVLIDRLNSDFIKTSNNEKVADFLLQNYRQRPNLYLCNSTENIENIRKQFPVELKKSIDVANQVYRKNFIFRYDWDMEKTNVPYQFINNIDWTLIPFGDEEWCFMLNRHRYWIDLGKAYMFTKNESYAKVWVHQVTDWIKKNPIQDEKLKKLSWRRIEAGIRCENWIKSFEYFKNSPSVTPAFFELFLNSLYEHAKCLDSSFSDFSKTSNWGVLEYQGLFDVAVFIPELKTSSLWKNDALKKLSVCAQLQILPDGTQWEQSPMYHNEVFQCLLNVNYLSQKFNIAIPEILIAKTKAMAMANVKWQKPNFHQPLIGDSDDSDLRGLLTFASFLFKDSVLKSRAYFACDYENSFLISPMQQAVYKNMNIYKPDFLSAFLQSSGDMVLRSSWSDSANYMILQLKKLACGHAHDDIFNFSLFANGKDYLVDGGRYTYVESDMRKQLKSSESHNVLSVDNLPNSIYESSWSNSYNADSRGIYTKITKEYDYAEADNTAYLRLPDPVLMTRRVLFIKPGLWLFFDSFTANGSHKYSQYFNFPNKEIKTSENQIETTYDKNNLIIRAVNPVKIDTETSKWSPEYNLLVENSRVEFSRESRGFDTFITALYFPDQSETSFTKLEILDRNNKKYKDEVAEAIKIRYDLKEFIVLVVYKLDKPSVPFYKIDDEIVRGKIVLLEKNGEVYKSILIKE